MPVLVLAIAEYFNKLLQDGGVAAIALLSKLGRIMVTAVDVAIVLIVAILSAEDRRAQRTSEMVYMVLSVKRSDV